MAETEIRSYEQACAEHEWRVPERYNIAADVCDKHARDEAGDGLGALRRRHPRARLGRAAGPLEPGRAHAALARDREGRPGRGRPPSHPRDRGDLLRHLEARRDPALDVGPLRRRGDPPPAHGLDAEAAGHRRRQRRPLRRLAGRRDPRPRRGRRPARRTADRPRLRGHLGRRPGAALLHVRHHRAGEGHRPRPPLHPRPRGVHLLPRRPRRRVASTGWASGPGPRASPPCSAPGASAPSSTCSSARPASSRPTSSTSSPATRSRTCSRPRPRCGR